MKARLLPIFAAQPPHILRRVLAVLPERHPDEEEATNILQTLGISFESTLSLSSMVNHAKL